MKNKTSQIFFDSNRNIRNIWWVVIYFLLLIVLLVPVIILSQYYGFEISYWQQAAIILTASVICQLLRRQPLNALTGKFNIYWIKECALGMIIGAALMALPAVMLYFAGAVRWQLNDFLPAELIQGMVVMVSVVVAEELLFRGFLFQRLIDALGGWPAQIVLAGFFLLTHLNNPGMTGSLKILASVNIFIASILFGLAYIKTKSLAMPLGIHFMANTMQGTVLGFGVSGTKEYSVFTPVFGNHPDWFTGGTFGLEASVFGLFILLIITTAYYYWSPAKDNIDTGV